MADSLTAELTYREVRAARDRVIRQALVLPLLLAGVADFGGAIAVLLIGRDHLASYFVPAYALVIVAGAWWYRRSARRSGVWLPVRPWLVILGPMIVAGMLLSRLGFALNLDTVEVAGPALANAAALAATGVWLRSRRLLLTAAAMTATVAVGLLLATGDRAVSVILFAYGLLLCQAARTDR